MEQSNSSGLGRIGRYQLIKEVGQGGMGSVYRAYQADLDRIVAVKVINQDYSKAADAHRRFEREALATARLQHPHILPIYEVGTDNGQPFIAMGYVTGGTLSDHIYGPTHLMSLERTLSFAPQIAQAMDYAHSRGIVHRDIKPDNILFDDVGHAYLADFGLAGGLGGYTFGAYPYLAPEVAFGAEITPASDIFAFGVVLFEVLAQKHPAPAETLEELQYVYQNGLFETDIRKYRPDLPPGVVVALFQALHFDPAARPATASAVVRMMALAAGRTVIEPIPYDPVIDDYSTSDEAMAHSGDPTPAYDMERLPFSSEMPVMIEPPRPFDQAVTYASQPTSATAAPEDEKRSILLPLLLCIMLISMIAFIIYMITLMR